MSDGRRIGVLALQGDVAAHARAIERAGAWPCEVLTEKDLGDIDALILPGGESTTISKGLQRLALFEPLRAFTRTGRPVLGTCAGAILLARHVENKPVPTLELMDVTIARNAYGTQVDSFSAPADPGAAGEFGDLRCVFIRAPRFLALGPKVRVLVRVDGDPVLVQQGNLLAASFHPELTDDVRVHRHLLRLAEAASAAVR